MEFHDLAWWEEQLGLDKAGRAQLEKDLQAVRKEPPDMKNETEYSKWLGEMRGAWGRTFDALGVGDSLDGLARMESFIGGVFSSELAPELEGCLYAGGMSGFFGGK